MILVYLQHKDLIYLSIMQSATVKYYYESFYKILALIDLRFEACYLQIGKVIIACMQTPKTGSVAYFQFKIALDYKSSLSTFLSSTLFCKQFMFSNLLERIIFFCENASRTCLSEDEHELSNTDSCQVYSYYSTQKNCLFKCSI